MAGGDRASPSPTRQQDPCAMPWSQLPQCLSSSGTGPWDHRHGHTPLSVPDRSAMYCSGENNTNQATNWTLFTHDTAPLIMCWLLHCTPRTTSSLLLTSTWFLTHHIPLHMSLFDVTYARSHSTGYLLWFHLRFLPLNSYHILMLIVLLTLSVPLWCLVSILSVSANVVLNSGLQKGYGANHEIRTDLNFYRSLLSDFSANVSTGKITYYHDKINNSPNSRMLFKTFSSLLCPPPPLRNQL